MRAEVEGVWMRASEIAKLIEERTGERITSHTVRIRMRRGLTGDALLAPPDSGWRRGEETGRRRLWPQKLVRVSVPGWGVRVG